MPIDYFQLAADLARAQGSGRIHHCVHWAGRVHSRSTSPDTVSARVVPSAGDSGPLTRAELHALIEDTHELERVIAEMEAQS